MFTFSDLMNQIQTVSDRILSDMVCDTAKNEEIAQNFSRHLLSTTNWFTEISWRNKKRFLLALLEDVKSAWTLSLVLKSLWTSRTKDAVLSVSEKPAWSSFDEAPMDHNRTALPNTLLAQVMIKEREWFLTLDPTCQAKVLLELLKSSGGPLMWEFLHRARMDYDIYKEKDEKVTVKTTLVPEEGHEKDNARSTTSKSGKSIPATETSIKETGRAQKELEANLTVWNQTVKTMKDKYKLEEIEVTFSDGTKKKSWKVNRTKADAVETVDFLQLLPMRIGKRILSYLPRAQLNDYARVNKYWAFLIEEMKTEMAIKQKIQADFVKLKEGLQRYDNNIETKDKSNLTKLPFPILQGINTKVTTQKTKAPGKWAKEKLKEKFSVKKLHGNKCLKPAKWAQIPIRNMADLTERLDRRGAADENLWLWCENILKKANKDGRAT